MILYKFDQKAHDKIMYEDGKEDGRADIVVNMLNDHAPLDKICEIARQNHIAIN